MKRSLLFGGCLLAATMGVAQDAININGDWNFYYAKDQQTADSVVNAGFYKEDYQPVGFDVVRVPSCWAVLGYEEPVYRGFKGDVASEGLYVHRFNAPQTFEGKRVLLHFGGVWASAEVWLNGTWLGRHDSGYTSFSLDASKAVKAGKENVLAVRVRQVYPGYQADTYDDWTLGGIYRDVSLEAMPNKRWMEKLTVVTDFDESYTDADLKVKVMVNDRHKPTLPGNYRSPGRPYALQLSLQDHEGNVVMKEQVEVEAHVSTGREVSQTFHVEHPRHWNAEQPYLYALQVDLLEEGKVVQTKRQHVGFREISTAGGVFRINGQAVKLKGVNYHDEHPDVGRAMTREHWLADILQMKEANINYIRACHYQHAKGVIELCDSLGMYVGAEVSLGGAGDLMYTPWFTGGMMQRTVETVERDLNNPSIIYWSVGNEDALTEMFMQGVKLTKALDPTRPVLLPWNADEVLPEEVDILAPHYWTAAQYDSIASRSSRPIITTEYVHAYGNQRFGGLEDCWKALHRHPAGAGGAVWMWADQGLKTPTKKDMARFGSINKEDEYLRIGPEGWDGITDSYRRPTRDYWEVKAVYAPVFPMVESVTFTASDSEVSVPVRNDYDFSSITDVDIHWELFVDDKVKDRGMASVDARPHTEAELTLPIRKLKNLKKGETAYFRLKFMKGMQEIACRAVELKPADTTFPPVKTRPVTLQEKDGQLQVAVGKRSYLFSHSTGLPYSVLQNGVNMLENIRPVVWHKLNDGDQIIKNRDFASGVHPDKYTVAVENWDVKEEKEKVIVRSRVNYTIDAANRISATYCCTVGADGSLLVEYALTPVMQTNYLPVVGMGIQLPVGVVTSRWLGLGPDESYPNKLAACTLGVWDAQGFSGTRSARWLELVSNRKPLRIHVDGYIDRDEADAPSINLLSYVLGRSEKGRLNDSRYHLLPGQTYEGSFRVDGD